MRTSPLVTMLAMASLATCADLSVGSATARQGERATGFVRVPAGSDAATDIPVIIINGTKPGPVLALVSGAHGTEYASIIALEKLGQTIDPAELTGAVIVAPLLNLASFHQKVPHVNPVDGKSMNRFYPGKAAGTQSERVSLAVATQIVEKCDYLIDYHGGDLDENLRQYSYWADTGNERLDAATKAMVLAFGLDHIIIQNARPDPARPVTTMSLTRYAQSKNKPAIAVEAGHSGTVLAEDVDVLVQGTWKVMRHLKMAAGKVTPIEHPLWIGKYSVQTSEHDGIFYPLVGPEAYVTKGMRVGYVTDYFGNKIWDVAAHASGVILYICSVPSMKKGDNVVDIGELAEGMR